MSKKKVIGWVLFIVWCGFILWMTLLSRKTVYTERVFRPDLFYEFRELLTGSEDGLRYTKLFLENILLFIPFGFLLPWKKNWWTVLITGCVFSVLIEITQYMTKLGELEFDDIIANTMGALIGVGLIKIFNKYQKNKVICCTTTKEYHMSQWEYYNHAAVSTTAPHESVDLSQIDDGSIWKTFEKEPLLVKWTTDFDCKEETKWWYCIRDGAWDLDSLSSSSSKKDIKRGLKKTKIEKIEPTKYLEDLYKVYYEAYRQYSNADNEMPKEVFIEQASKSTLDWWAGFEVESGVMVGWMNVSLNVNWCEIKQAKFWPEYRNTRVSDALYATLLDYYLNQLKMKYVSSGSRSINHETNTQEYKEIHFGYRKAYCKLHILFNKKIKWIIDICYPFRGLIGKMKGKRIHQLHGLLMLKEYSE